MLFADGTSFKGRWEAGAWVQSAADPARCRLRGKGLARAVAGETAGFVVQVRGRLGLLKARAAECKNWGWRKSDRLCWFDFGQRRAVCSFSPSKDLQLMLADPLTPPSIRPPGARRGEQPPPDGRGHLHCRTAA